MISLEKICLTSPLTGQYLLKDISLEIQRGDRLAIVGATGAGKTTFLRLLNGLISPSSGRLQLAGQDYGQISPISLRRQVVLVSQEVRLLEMTVKDALAYPLVLQNFTPGQIKETVGHWIEKFHIPSTWLDRTEPQLSLGQRQWVSICRALVLQPPVLLLDEPTSALDQGRAEDLLHILGELNSFGKAQEPQQNQTTILMVNHQLDIVQQFATKLIYLQTGELAIEAQLPEIPWKAIAQNLQTYQQQLHQEWGE